tara:strand:- start:54 stop:1784 length:1731 start_codon:yes stop_codon:yes gene_type:complete
MKNLINNFVNTKTIIKRYYKKNLIFLNILFIAQSILEIATIFIILLLLKQILNVDVSIFEKFGITLDRNSLIMYLCIFTFFFSVLSFFLNLYINKKIVSFGYEIYASVVNKIFNNFINSDYSSINSMSYSFASSRMLNETRRLCELVIIPYYLAISKLVVLVLMVVGLIIYKPLISVSSIILITIIFYIFNYFTKLKNIVHAKEISFLDKKMLSIVNNVFFGFKDLKLNNLNKFFYFDFENTQKKLANALMQIKFTQTSARYFIELSVLSIFIFSMIYLNYKNLLNGEVISVIGFYLFVMLKMLPYINVVYLNLSQWSAHYHTLEIVDSFNKRLIINPPNLDKKKNIGEIKEIDIKKFSYGYDEKNQFINLRENIKLKKKTIIGLKGASGSGKTTLLDILSGVIKIDNSNNEGGIHINNDNLNDLDINEYYKRISYVQQRVFLLHTTIKKNIVLNNTYDEGFFHKVLNLSQCSNFLDSKLKDNSTRIDDEISFGRENLSGGQIQRIGIARALYKRPEILIFDEATNALDKEIENTILKNIFEIDEINFIFISAHNDKILEKCDSVLEFKDGLIKLN